jgi:putative membrane protein
MNETQRAPKAVIVDDGDRSAPGGHAKKRAPRAFTDIDFEPEPADGELAVAPPAPPPARGFRWGALLAGSLGSLFVVWLGLAIADLVQSALARSQTLGGITIAAAALAALALLAIVAREVWSLMRLARIEHIQADAARAINFDDGPAAKRAVDGVMALYRGRHDALWGLESIRQHSHDILDPRDRVRMVDRHLLSPRDDDAHRLIARTARRVTLVTTVAPTAVLDILFVGVQNLRMLRQLASLYGGRPSALATLRLARMVLGHLAVTGGLALTDNVMQHVIGKGVLGRLSARFGEGTVNGIMTARIGLAARDVCRPIPQDRAGKETLGSLLREVISFGEGGEKA